MQWRQRFSRELLETTYYSNFAAGEEQGGWKQVIVYPGAFRVHRRHHDEDTGLVSEWHEDLDGESWEHGPLVLSWDDVAADLAAPEPGYLLVAHEMAHKLDALDGAMDGTQ